jgi:hypothetical protein
MMYSELSLPWERPGYVAPEGKLVSKNDEWETVSTRDHCEGAFTFRVRPRGEGWQGVPTESDKLSLWRRRVIA